MGHIRDNSREFRGQKNEQALTNSNTLFILQGVKNWEGKEKKKDKLVLTTLWNLQEFRRCCQAPSSCCLKASPGVGGLSHYTSRVLGSCSEHTWELGGSFSCPSRRPTDVTPGSGLGRGLGPGSLVQHRYLVSSLLTRIKTMRVKNHRGGKLVSWSVQKENFKLIIYVFGEGRNKLYKWNPIHLVVLWMFSGWLKDSSYTSANLCYYWGVESRARPVALKFSKCHSSGARVGVRVLPLSTGIRAVSCKV